MRTTITVPDSIYDAAERIAAQLGMSRSEMYTRAVTQFVESQQMLGVRERLDSVYASDPRASELEPAVANLQEQSLVRKW